MHKFTAKNFLVLALGTVVLFSCSKDDDKTPSPSNPSNQKCRITNVMEDGGSEETIYEYDSQHRLIKEIYKENGQLEGSYITYEYNNAGFISKSTDWNGTTMQGYDLYTYNSDGRPAKRETFYDTGSGVVLQSTNSYDYDSNKRLVRTNRYNASAPAVIESYSTYSYPTGSTAREQGYYDLNNDGTPDHEYTSDYTFDDKKSPQLLLGVAFDDEFLSEHNVTKEVYTDVAGSGASETYTYSYLYNAEGFPTKVTADYGGTSPEISNVTYICN